MKELVDSFLNYLAVEKGYSEHTIAAYRNDLTGLTDFAQKEARYDLILDAVGVRSFSDCRRALSPQGIYVTTEFSPTLVLQGVWASMTGSQKLVPMPPKGPNTNIQNLYEELLEAGKLTPVIDRCYPLSEVPEAFRYYAKGHTRGRVIINV